MSPERCVFALRSFVMQYQEVANLCHLRLCQSVELGHDTVIDGLTWKEQEQAREGRLNQVNTCRFEWLKKAAREANRYAVLLPDLFAATSDEAQSTRLSSRCAIKPTEQNTSGLV